MMALTSPATSGDGGPGAPTFGCRALVEEATGTPPWRSARGPGGTTLGGPTVPSGFATNPLPPGTGTDLPVALACATAAAAGFAVGGATVDVPTGLFGFQTAPGAGSGAGGGPPAGGAGGCA